MNYLVDTHILLWLFLEPENLSEAIRKILTDEENTVYYSPISLWEISIKFSLGKLVLQGGTPQTFFFRSKKVFYSVKTSNLLKRQRCTNCPTIIETRLTVFSFGQQFKMILRC
ncbi:hypothetical protein FACS189427_11780 [Planctomycetales bacterium]|nr:hypothetical protein FACS189427_11780 [Planctomycetales bacterium]